MIDPTAVVSPDAKLGENVRIDSYAIVEGDVEIGSGSWLGHHSVIRSHTGIGCDNRIHEFTVLGGEPQSIHYHGEPTRLEIGDRNSIREMVTIHRGTEPGQVTRLGDDNIIMAYSHIAHDCQVGNFCVFANGTNLAGHVIVGDYAFYRRLHSGTPELQDWRSLHDRYQYDSAQGCASVHDGQRQSRTNEVSQ